MDSKLHPRHPINGRYDLKQLIQVNPELHQFVHINQHQIETINFSDPVAVKELNRSLLKYYYNINDWDLPNQALCPPIPGRADYLYYLNDLPLKNAGGPKWLLDIGVGANCIYPLIATKAFQWKVIGSDISQASLDWARKLVENNQLTEMIELRLQPNPTAYFDNILDPHDYFHFTICNPPFYQSAEEASTVSSRKVRNLNKGKATALTNNFGGQSNELYCQGGELAFVLGMINESVRYKTQCQWFTCLISQKNNAEIVERSLRKMTGVQYRFVSMAQGQKQSRFVAWTFSL